MKLLFGFARLHMDVIPFPKNGERNSLGQRGLRNLAKLAIGVDGAFSLMDVQTCSDQDGRIKGQSADNQ